MKQKDLTDFDIKAFVEERDSVLLSGDIDLLMRFHQKHNPGSPPIANRELAEISMHKARTAALSLPLDIRRGSHQWLTDRGYSSFFEETKQ